MTFPVSNFVLLTLRGRTVRERALHVVLHHRSELLSNNRTFRHVLFLLYHRILATLNVFIYYLHNTLYIFIYIQPLISNLEHTFFPPFVILVLRCSSGYLVANVGLREVVWLCGCVFVFLPQALRDRMEHLLRELESPLQLSPLDKNN